MPEQIEEVSKAYRKGLMDAVCDMLAIGYTRKTENPYEPGTQEYSDWQTGYEIGSGKCHG